MSERDLMQFDVDMSPAEQTVRNFDNDLKKKTEEWNNTLEKTRETSKFTFNKVVSMARLGWSAMDQLLRMSGVNIEGLSLVIQSGLSAISLLTQIFSAQESNPFTAAFGAFSLAQIPIAVTSFIMAQLQQQQAAQYLASASRSLYSVGNFFGGLSYL